MNKKRLVVLVSGNGSNLQAILDAVSDGDLPAEVCAVISNKKEAYALERAKKCGVPALVKTKLKTVSREGYDAELAELVLSYQPDWVILAGWMRILTMSFLKKFPRKVVNLHPALPGTFPGVDAIHQAYQAFQQGKITQTGVMVHLVPDEGVDDGPVLSEAVVPIFAEDHLSDLEERIHACEHVLLVKTIKQLIIMED